MIEQSAVRRPLRLWPGVAAVALQWICWLVVPAIVPEWSGNGIIAAVVLAFAIIVWWLFFSRAPWLERLGVLAVMVAAVAATSLLVHESIANGMMGFMLYLYALPAMSLALVAGLVLSRRLPAAARRASIAASTLLACAALALIRTDGVTGNVDSDLHFRWTPTAEQRLLAQAREGEAALPAPVPASKPAGPVADPPPVETQPEADPRADGAPSGSSAAAAAARPAPAVSPSRSKRMPAWPGFRGPSRDSVIRGVRIETNWTASPPIELWRRPIGPGWSSVAVDANRIYTQEQRGDDEIVSAYELTTGAPIWSHRDAARFWESNAGAGPRGTPTLANGRVYTIGATGIINALDARDGAVVWSRNIATDTGHKVPDWGIASSPLVVGDLVVAAAAGWLIAYEAATGRPRWLGPKEGWGYASPHLAAIDGVEQIVLLNGAGAIGVAPADGTVLWKHAWRGDGILQPVVLDGGDVLIGSGSGINAGVGVRRIGVGRGPGGWTTEERWTSNGLKPYFNDFVVHEGHAFGFDGSILSCIDLADGKRKWKGGRFGHGQLFLLPEQDLMLVLSEDGELALVSATPDKFTEIARAPALDGKTWNHPVLAGDVLLVRNGEQMAAFRLPGVSR